MPARPNDAVLLFEGFRLEAKGSALLRHAGNGRLEAVALGSRALAVLAVLADRSGELITKAELIGTVWPDICVAENNLAVQISALRRVLDEGREAGSCIRTIAGRGYRFDAAVMRIEPQADNLQPRTTPTAGRQAAARSWRGAAAAAMLVLLGVAASAPWLTQRPPSVRAAPRSSIAVLPFARLGGAGDQQILAEAITQNLTIDLSRVSDIVVISSGAFVTQDKPVDREQVAGGSGARYVATGGIQRLGDRVYVNAQLIDAASGAYVWSGHFEHLADDLFTAQNEITGRLAVSLKYALISAEAARPTSHPDAQDFLFRGRAGFYNPSSRQNYDRLIGDFSHALELDAHSAEAKSYLSMALTGRALDQMADPGRPGLDRAQILIDEAQAIAPRSTLVHYALAQLLRARGRCDEAITEYEAVLGSDRNWFTALSHLGRCMTYLGQIDEAIALQQRVIQLGSPDENLGVTHFRLGEAYLLKSRPELAIPWLEKARVAQPEMGYIHGELAAAFALEHQPEHAAGELAQARRLIPARYSSIAAERAGLNRGMAEIRPLWEATVFEGLRKAGVPE